MPYSHPPQTGPSQDGRTRCVSCPTNAICSARIVGSDLVAPSLPPDTASTAATLLSTLHSRLDAVRSGASPSRRLQEQLPAASPTTPDASAAADPLPADAMDFLARLRALLGPEVELGDLEELAMGQEQRVDATARAAASTLLRGVMVPSDGFWHSSMFSDQVGRDTCGCVRGLRAGSFGMGAFEAYSVRRSGPEGNSFVTMGFGDVGGTGCAGGMAHV